MNEQTVRAVRSTIEKTIADMASSVRIGKYLSNEPTNSKLSRVLIDNITYTNVPRTVSSVGAGASVLCVYSKEFGYIVIGVIV